MLQPFFVVIPFLFIQTFWVFQRKHVACQHGKCRQTDNVEILLGMLVTSVALFSWNDMFCVSLLANWPIVLCSNYRAVAVDIFIIHSTLCICLQLQFACKTLLNTCFLWTLKRALKCSRSHWMFKVWFMHFFSAKIKEDRQPITRKFRGTLVVSTLARQQNEGWHAYRWRDRHVIPLSASSSDTNMCCSQGHSGFTVKQNLVQADLLC